MINDRLNNKGRIKDEYRLQFLKDKIEYKKENQIQLTLMEDSVEYKKTIKKEK